MSYFSLFVFENADSLSTILDKPYFDIDEILVACVIQIKTTFKFSGSYKDIWENYQALETVRIFFGHSSQRGG